MNMMAEVINCIHDEVTIIVPKERLQEAAESFAVWQVAIPTVPISVLDTTWDVETRLFRLSREDAR